VTSLVRGNALDRVLDVVRPCRLLDVARSGDRELRATCGSSPRQTATSATSPAGAEPPTDHDDTRKESPSARDTKPRSRPPREASLSVFGVGVPHELAALRRYLATLTNARLEPGSDALTWDPAN